MVDSTNVLLLVVDSLRYDIISGKKGPHTPNIDRLVDDGVTFSRCFSQGISTAPAMTAMLTGRLPLDYGGHWYLEEDQPTFAQQFQRVGYTTGAVHSNPYVSERRNFDRGFDQFHEEIVAFEPDRGLEQAPEKILRLLSRLSRILSRTPYMPAPKVNKELLSFVESSPDSWFCWAQYMDVHGPYLGGQATYRKKLRAEFLWRKAAVRSPDDVTEPEHEELWQNYCAEIEYLDKHIGGLLDALREQGELEDTLIILTADHGEEFYEHGRYGHGNLPYTELTHVPLVMSFPSSADINTTNVNNIVRSVDILPTAIDFIGETLDSEMERRCIGQSLLPAIDGESVAPDYVVTEKRIRGEQAFRIGIRDGEWCYLYDGKTDCRHLYDLNTDPNEQEDLVDNELEVRNRFETVLEERFSEIQETSDGITTPNLDEDTGVEERLRALGYRN